MIGPLLLEVDRICEAMGALQAELKASEAATRYAVIDRVLSLLGWDVHDAKVVKPEYAAGAASNARVDYALLRAGKPVAFIEAKPLGASLQMKDLEQLSNYCHNRSVEWGILTNGDAWQLLDAKAFGKPLEERVRLGFSLSQASGIAALQNLVTLFACITGREPAVHAEAVSTSCSAQSVSSPPPPAPGGQALSALSEHALPKSECRVLITFADGHRIEAMKWGEVLRGVLEWLVTTGRLSAAHCPLRDAAGRKRYLVNTVPQHADGSGFKTSKALPAGLHYEANYDAADCCRNAVHALTCVGLKPEQVSWSPLS